MLEKVIHVYLPYPKYKNEEKRRKLMKMNVFCSSLMNSTGCPKLF